MPIVLISLSQSRPFLTLPLSSSLESFLQLLYFLINAIFGLLLLLLQDLVSSPSEAILVSGLYRYSNLNKSKDWMLEFTNERKKKGVFAFLVLGYIIQCDFCILFFFFTFKSLNSISFKAE